MIMPRNWKAKSKRRKPPKQNNGVGRKSKESLEQQAKDEIDAIFAEFAVQLAALKGCGISGALYGRHSSEMQDSIPAQIRSLLIDAIEKGIYISREHVFYDIAVRGSKQHRKGLDAATSVIRDTETKILMVFKTNRLYRKMYRALEYVERLIKTWNARIIFTRDNLDSASADYEDIKLQLLAMLDEHGRRAHVDNIQSKHLDMFARMLVHGTITFGYFGEPIEGELTKLGRPRRRYTVDEFESEYVVQIFRWFVEEGMSIAEIIQTLNDDPDAPLPPRAEKEWTRVAVNHLLKNTRYIGVFKYGKQESIDQPDVDYVLRRDRDEPLGVAMVEELRIVPDSLFFPAQELLKENKSRGGRKANPSSKPTASEVVRGIFECPEHGCALWASGGNIFCKRCNRLPRESRYLHSRLNTDLAIAQLLDGIGQALCNDDELIRDSYERSALAIANLDSPDDREIERLKVENRKLGSQIKFAKENVGESSVEQQETKVLISKLRVKRQKVESRLRQIDADKQTPTEVPDLDSWSTTVRSLGEELLSCRDQFDKIRLSRIRRLIQLLVGGRIKLIQCGENQPRMGWHKACFTIDLGAAMHPNGHSESDLPKKLIELEFKNTDKVLERLIAESDEAYRLDTVEKLPRSEIGALKGWSKSKVTSLLKRAYGRRGQVYVDGRTRRKLTKGSLPVHQKIADDVVRQFSDGLELKQIVIEMDYTIDTIRAAFRYWHESRGLPVPLSQKKMKLLMDSQRAYKLDSTGDLTRGEIAKIIGCSPAKLTRLLKEEYARNDEEFRDGRGSNSTSKNLSFLEIANRVGPLVDAGMSFAKIADQLDLNIATVGEARTWYCSYLRDAA